MEAAFFVVSVMVSAIAIYELRRARNMLSDALLKNVLKWMTYSTFALAIISFLVGINFIVSVSPEFSVLLSEYNHLTLINIFIWVAIACNIMVAMKFKEIAKTFGFKESKEAELGIMNFFFGKK